MIPFLRALIPAARETLVDPDRAARRAMALGLSVSEGLMAVGLTALIATLLTALMQLIYPVRDAEMAGLFFHPLWLALSQFGLMVLGAFLMWWVGRLFGGTGTFAKALVLVAWLEGVLILLQVLAAVVLTVLPLLAGPVALASLFAFFYLVTHFTLALNGFSSLIKTLFGIVATLFAVAFAASLLLMLLIMVSNV